MWLAGKIRNFDLVLQLRLVTTQVQGSEQFETVGESKEKKLIDSVEDDDEDFPPKKVKLAAQSKWAEINVETFKETDEEAEVDNYVKTASLWSIVKLNSPEWLSLVLGCLGAAAMGTAFPIFAILFGSILQVILLPEVWQLSFASLITNERYTSNWDLEFPNFQFLPSFGRFSVIYGRKLGNWSSFLPFSSLPRPNSPRNKFQISFFLL